MIALTGANSAVGVNLLGHVVGRQGLRAVAVVRSSRAASALPEADAIVPRIVAYDDVGGLTAALEGAGSVVHLAGILIETRRSRYREANVATTEAVVAAARAADVGHVVFISVIGADPSSSNRYLRSKGEAEQVVADAGIDATIIRTPILLGPGTAGAAGLARAVDGGRAKLLGGGRYTMRPLDSDDLSVAILNACAAPPSGVAVHELVGPEGLTYRELVTRFAGRLGRTVTVGSVPIGVAKAGAALTSLLRGGGMTPTVIDVITADEVVAQNADQALGVTLTPLDETLGKVVEEVAP